MRKNFFLQNLSCTPRQIFFKLFYHSPPGLIYGIYFNVTPELTFKVFLNYFNLCQYHRQSDKHILSIVRNLTIRFSFPFGFITIIKEICWIILQHYYC